MKNIFKIFAILGVTLLTFSCEEEDKSPFLRITNNAPTAGILRTININTATETNVTAGTYQLSNLTDSVFDLEVEENDAQNGGLISNVEVFVRFDDRSESNGDSSVTEVALRTIEPSAFTRNTDSGLLRTNIIITANEAITALGLDAGTDIAEDDIFRVRLQLNLTDGQSFSSDNLEGNVTGAFFRSPFTYPITVE